MQNNQPFSPLKNPLLDSPNQAGGYMLNSSHIILPPSFGGGTVLLPPSGGILPFQGVEFQPSEVCPRNFIIFDQTADNRSKVMFHPAIGAKFRYAAADDDDSRAPFYSPNKDCADDDEEEEEPREVTSSTLKEDLEDIDALLSFDDEYGEEEEEEEEEEVSTARTDMNYRCNSPDSCSNYESSPPARKMKRKMSGCNGSERKRVEMRKMVRALRGIIPGANQMNSVSVLDEAVRYLKSLKVEVQKLGGVGKKL